MLSKDEIHQAPWILQRHLDGEIDLDKELTARFRTMPVLSTFKARQYDAQHATATLSMQDGAATVRVDVDRASNVTLFAFTFRSMLALSFHLDELGSSHRDHWVDLMRREQIQPAFLWGPPRWASDYLITVARPFYTNIYAFSSHHFEAAARLTPDVTGKLIDWLDERWKTDVTLDDDSHQLTTW